MCYRFLGIRPRAVNFFFAVLIATAYGLTVCLPGMSMLTSTFFKTLSACLISVTAFYGHIKRGGGIKGLVKWGKCTCIFAAVSFAYAAVVTTFQYAPFAKESIYINNGEIYYNIPVPYLLTAILLLLGAQSVILRVRKSKTIRGENVTAEMGIGEHRCSLSLLADSGNLATDPISGAPLVFLDKRTLSFLPEAAVKAKDMTELFRALSSQKGFEKRVFIVPCRTALGGGTCVAFRPDFFRVEGADIKVLLALPVGDGPCGDGFDGIINQNLTQQKGETKC